LANYHFPSRGKALHTTLTGRDRLQVGSKSRFAEQEGWALGHPVTFALSVEGRSLDKVARLARA
jgi:hypothetical protein